MLKPTDEDPSEPLETFDIQRFVLSSHSRLKCSGYRLLRVTAQAAARRWLAAQVDDVTTAESRENEQPWALQIAFTHAGLAALGLSDDALKGFPNCFSDGMASDRRARILGDDGASAPERWDWGGPDTKPVHVLLLCFGSDEHELLDQLNFRTPIHSDGIEDVKTLTAGREPGDNREHFGFVDGVGQPVIAGSGLGQRQYERTAHATIIPAGEVILGYRDFSGAQAPFPTVANADDPLSILPVAPVHDRGISVRRDFGRNGTYLVFRQLEQDVAGFWRAVRDAANHLWPNDPNAITKLAAKLVGRWPSGAPLVLFHVRDPGAGLMRAACHGAPPVAPDHEEPRNDFTYAHDDPHGLHCPLGAHIRRANPRDMLGTDGDKALSSANRHRLLRRGRSYGSRIVDPFVHDGKPRGLYFICLNGDLERQFEFVQQSWLNNPAFAGLRAEVDPLIGKHPGSTGMFTIPADPLRNRIPDVRSHVTTKGGAYWFLPGLRALRFLTRVIPDTSGSS